MHMAVGPAHRDLDDGVQPAEAGVARHLQPPPDRRLDPFKRYLQLVNRRLRRRGGLPLPRFRHSVTSPSCVGWVWRLAPYITSESIVVCGEVTWKARAQSRRSLLCSLG